MDIGSRLKEERERLGLSQTAFGAIGDFGKTTVIAWERGTAFPNALFLSDIAAIGADIRYIVTGDREAPPPEVLSPDEHELLALFRAAPLAVKAAAIGALQAGVSPSAPIQAAAKKVKKQINVSAPGGEAAGRDIVNKGRKG